MVLDMGGPSERDYREKLDKIKQKLDKKARDIKSEFEKIEKAKVDLLKKTKSMKHDTEREIAKVEEEIAKSKDLAPESKSRLQLEIDNLKGEVRRRYSELEMRITETL